MRYKPKLYGIYDIETNLIFCGNLDECSKFLNVDKISFHRMIKWCKDTTHYTRQNYRVEVIGELSDFKIER